MSLILAYTKPECVIKTGLLLRRKGGTLAEYMFFGDKNADLSVFCEAAWKHLDKVRRVAMECAKNPSEGEPDTTFKFKGYTIPGKDFAAAVHYVLTNTDLRPHDPRLLLFKQIKMLRGKEMPGPLGTLVMSVCQMKKVPGWNVGIIEGNKGKRLGRE